MTQTQATQNHDLPIGTRMHRRVGVNIFTELYPLVLIVTAHLPSNTDFSSVRYELQTPDGEQTFTWPSPGLKMLYTKEKDS